MRQFGKKETVSSIEKYRNDRIAMQQEKLLQDLRYTSERARIFLRRGIDTGFYRKYLRTTRDELLIVQDGIFVNQGSGQTARNLDVAASILDGLLDKLNERRSIVVRHVKSLTDYINQIDSLSADSALYTFPFDSVQTVRYIQKIAVVAKDLGPADTALRRSSTCRATVAAGLST